MKYFRVIVVILILINSGCRKHGQTLNSCNHQDTIELFDSLRKLDFKVELFKVINPKLAIVYAKKELLLSKQFKNKKGLVIANLSLGVAYHSSRKDSSFYYFNVANKLTEEGRLHFLKPPIIYNIASLYSSSSDYKNAVLLFDSAIMLGVKYSAFIVASNAENSLGLILKIMQDTASSRKALNKAYKIAFEHNLNIQMGNASANLAIMEKSNSSRLIKLKHTLPYYVQSEGAEDLVAEVLINIGNYQQNPDSALTYYYNALTIADKGDIKDLKMGIYNDMAYSYLDKGETKLAEDCIIKHALPLAQEIHNADWTATLFDTYADVCLANHNYKKAYANEQHAFISRKTADSIKNSSQVRLLIAMLDSKNMETKIQEDEHKIESQQNYQQRVETSITITLFVLVVLLFFIITIRNHFRLLLQSEKIYSARKIISIEETVKGNLGRDLHDTSGHLIQGIAGQIAEINFADPSEQQRIETRIKEMRDSIRRLSHRNNSVLLNNFPPEELITSLCEDMQTITGIKLQYELIGVPPLLHENIVLHLYRILQELLTNASKHSNGAKIHLNVIFTARKIVCQYKDNGPGFNIRELPKTSIGVYNIQERIKLLGGTSILSTAPREGVSWEISLPIIK